MAAARQLALQNGAAWATPEVSGSSVQVTAGEDAMLFLGGFLGQASSPVGASAEAGCGAPTTGCTTWPITLEVNKYPQRQSADKSSSLISRTARISIATDIYDCSHVFLAPPESTAQRGWWSSPIGGCWSSRAARCHLPRLSGLSGSRSVNAFPALEATRAAPYRAARSSCTSSRIRYDGWVALISAIL